MCPFRQQKVLEAEAAAIEAATVPAISPPTAAAAISLPQAFYAYHHLNHSTTNGCPSRSSSNTGNGDVTMMQQQQQQQQLMMMDPKRPTTSPLVSTCTPNNSNNTDTTGSSLGLVPFQHQGMSMVRSDNLRSQPPPPQPPNDISPPEASKTEMSMSEVIEMLKNLAAKQEKQFKWEQSARKLTSYPDSDPNKSQLVEIIDYVENHESSTQEKAIYLYEQLGHRCRQLKNYIGAAKAFERAAALRLDFWSEREESIISQLSADQETISSTIKDLESAIHNYDVIHKYKHAGTLHYQCSKILRLINASREKVEQHHVKALEYFTKPNHEFKQRKRIDGHKISCYSSSWMTKRMHSDAIDKFTTTTTTKFHTNTIKFHHEEPVHSYDSDDSDSNHSGTPPPGTAGSKKMQFSFGEERHHSNYHHPDDYFVPDYFPQFDPNSDGSYPSTPTGTPPLEKQSKRHSPFDTVRSNLFESSKESASSMKASRHHYSYHHHHHQHKKMMSSSSSSGPYSTHPRDLKNMIINNSNNGANANNQIRCIEDRIESAKKLVKKLHKICPFYEVSASGDDAGRVYCRICDRYLGAVSSTLKNHVNTQEHRQAYEDSQTGTAPTSGLTHSQTTFQPNPPQITYPTSDPNPAPFYQTPKPYVTFEGQTTSGSEQPNPTGSYGVNPNDFMYRGGTSGGHNSFSSTGQQTAKMAMPTTHAQNQPRANYQQMGSNGTGSDYSVKGGMNMPVLAYQ